MAQTVCLLLGAPDRKWLEAIALDRNRQRKHVKRARVVLACAGGEPVQQVAALAALVGVSRPMVWRWQQRFAEEGMGGLLRDKTRRPGKAPIPAEMARVVTLTCGDPPGEATHWTGRAMAKAAGISLRSVQRIWEAHQLKPHRLRTFKRSRDPQFAEKLAEVAHDYKRRGTTTSFAALNVLDGTVIGRCMQRHRHEEFIRFLNAIECVVPAGKLIEAVVDNYATHKHPKVRAWLERHPGWTFHFTPISGSWLSAVETFFSTLTRKRI